MKTIGVIGAGQMGTGIAQVSAAAGYRTLVSDRDVALAEKGKAGIAKGLGRLVEKEEITVEARDAALALINAEINRQALFIAYLDDFKLMMIVTFAALPLILLVKKAGPPGAGGPPVHAD